MSECVVRMEMPKCCDDCDANYDCCACGISGEFWFRNSRYKEFDSSKERLPNCPIVCQLPEGHGRLVDADELADDMKARKAFFGRKSDPQCLVKDAHTIVPAERSET